MPVLTKSSTYCLLAASVPILGVLTPLITPDPLIVMTEFFSSLPEPPSNNVIASVVAPAGPTTSPVAAIVIEPVLLVMETFAPAVRVD